MSSATVLPSVDGNATSLRALRALRSRSLTSCAYVVPIPMNVLSDTYHAMMRDGKLKEGDWTTVQADGTMTVIPNDVSATKIALEAKLGMSFDVCCCRLQQFNVFVLRVEQMKRLRETYVAMVKSGKIVAKDGEWVAVYADGTFKVAATAGDVIAGRTDDCYSVQHNSTFTVAPCHTGFAHVA